MMGLSSWDDEEATPGFVDTVETAKEADKKEQISLHVENFKLQTERLRDRSRGSEFKKYAVESAALDLIALEMTRRQGEIWDEMKERGEKPWGRDWPVWHRRVEIDDHLAELAEAAKTAGAIERRRHAEDRGVIREGNAP